MKRKILFGALILILATQLSWGEIPKTIGYQGILADDSGTADGTRRFTFNLYDDESSSGALWSEDHFSVPINNGVFNVILGSSNPLGIPFDRQYWLGVKVEGSPELVPRTRLTSTPYSLGGNFWNLGGNSGASPGDNFLGTTDNTPLELWVFGARVLRLEPHSTSPNIIGGFSGNWVQTGVFGAAIGGGGENDDENRVANNYGTVAGGRDNRAGEEDYAAVGGGRSNIASGDYSTVPGGRDNVAAGDYSFAVGRRAKADHDGAFVWGDSTNTDIISTGDDQFIIRANGGTQIYGGELAVDNVIHSINGGFRFPDGTEQTTAISLESLMSLIPFWRG